MTKKQWVKFVFYISLSQKRYVRRKNFLNGFLLFRDSSSGCKIFISMATFTIRMVFFFSKKSSGPYFVKKDFLPPGTPETIILLRPSSKTKESLKYWLIFPIYKQWRCCFESLLHLTVFSPKKFNGHGISIEFHETFWCHEMLLRVSQGMDG